MPDVVARQSWVILQSLAYTRTPPVEAALIPVTTPSQPLCAV